MRVPFQKRQWLYRQTSETLGEYHSPASHHLSAGGASSSICEKHNPRYVQEHATERGTPALVKDATEAGLGRGEAGLAGILSTGSRWRCGGRWGGLYKVPPKSKDKAMINGRGVQGHRL